MGRQQKQSEYETIAHKLLRHGVHFVVTNLVIRSKEGALANASNPERGGPMGKNFLVQSTGVNSLVQKLAEKVKEIGGSVKKVDTPVLGKEFRDVASGPKKILIARKMREEFLSKKTNRLKS